MSSNISTPTSNIVMPDRQVIPADKRTNNRLQYLEASSTARNFTNLHEPEADTLFYAEREAISETMPMEVDGEDTADSHSTDLIWVQDVFNHYEFLKSCGVFVRGHGRDQSTGEANSAIWIITCPHCATTLEEGDSDSSTDSRFIQGLGGLFEHVQNWHLSHRIGNENTATRWVKQTILHQKVVSEKRVFEMVTDPKTLEALRLQPCERNQRAGFKAHAERLKNLVDFDRDGNPVESESDEVTWVEPDNGNDGNKVFSGDGNLAKPFSFLFDCGCVVRDFAEQHEKWIELRCPHCNANSKGNIYNNDKWTYFQGVKGFYQHLKYSHNDFPTTDTDRETWNKWTFEKCMTGVWYSSASSVCKPEKSLGNNRSVRNTPFRNQHHATGVAQASRPIQQTPPLTQNESPGVARRVNRVNNVSPLHARAARLRTYPNDWQK